MTSNIEIYKSSDFGSIRVIEKDKEVWFVGKEVAAILGYSNTRDALSKHVDDEDKATVAIHDGRQNRNTVIINESGLYSLVLSSKLTSAKQFKRWVTKEVLPAIRKEGAYITEKLLNDPELLITAVTRLKEVREKCGELKVEIESLKPAAEFGAAIGNCKDSILIRDYAKLLSNGGVKIGQDRLFSWLHSNGFIYRDKGTDQWIAYKKYVDMEFFKISERRIKISNHGDKIFFTIRVTGKGQQYFLEKLKEQYSVKDNVTYEVTQGNYLC